MRNVKIAIICPDFQESNIRKLPWKYVYEIAKYLGNRHEVVLITDSDKKDVDGIEIVLVEKIFEPLKGETDKLLNVILQENPDKCIMLLGLTSFLRREFKIKQPVIGIFTSPVYSFWELVNNIGIKDSLKYRKYTSIHYVNSLIPDFFVKKWVDKYKSIVFLSSYTKKKLIKKGLKREKAVLIPVGIDENFLDPTSDEAFERLKKKINPENIPVIMYFTSPLILRGTDTLTKAFTRLRSERECKLIFLSRIDHDELRSEERHLKKIAKGGGVSDSVEILSDYLSPSEIKNYLAVADIICLPFKLVISDVPVSIMEAIALGKPVISTNVACIPELIEDSGLLVTANSEIELVDALRRLLDDEDLIKDFVSNGRDFIANHPTWPDIGNLLEETILGELNDI